MQFDKCLCCASVHCIVPNNSANREQRPLSVYANGYGKCPKNSNTKVSDKMTYANSADPDQTAPEGGAV